MILLDTHVLIWAIQDDPRLGRRARGRIDREAGEGELLIAAITAWEVALLLHRGKIELPLAPAEWFGLILRQPRFALLPLDPATAAEAVALDWAHRDPADRMIVATARIREVPLVTADRAILAYAAAGHVEALDARD